MGLIHKAISYVPLGMPGSLSICFSQSCVKPNSLRSRWWLVSLLSRQEMMRCGMVWYLLCQCYLDGCPLKGEVGSKLSVR